MKRRAFYFGILLSIIFVFSSHAQQGDFPVLKGHHLGQKPPGMALEVFVPGIISTDLDEGCSVFFRNGTMFTK